MFKTRTFLTSLLGLLLIGPQTYTKAQSIDLVSIDSLQKLEEVYIPGKWHPIRLLESTTAVGLIKREHRWSTPGLSLLDAFNQKSGVRMEERSPGSYRLSVRGSLVRSPFGVRNVKIYWGDIPMTDASGNTYFNLIDPAALQSATVLKGPDGSLFGANSGGVIHLNMSPEASKPFQGEVQVKGGGFGLFQQHIQGAWNNQKGYQGHVHQGFQDQLGYRDHSAMHRLYFQTGHRWQYSPQTTLEAYGLYGDLGYQTPGAINLQQWKRNPRAARPGDTFSKGAEVQRAGIDNKTVLGGVVHRWEINPQWQHVVSVFGTKTDFENPFITNFENRDESNAGFRTYAQHAWASSNGWHIRTLGGIEWQQSKADIQNNNNDAGIKGDPMSHDKVGNRQQFYFLRTHLDYAGKVQLEGGLSYNQDQYQFQTFYPTTMQDKDVVRSTPVWMPRLAVNLPLTSRSAWRVSISKGYSPPTMAEIRASNQVINTELKAEQGWNLETGFRWQSKDQRFDLDMSLYEYHLNDAIVSYSNEQGQQYFQNTGKIKLQGWEWETQYWIIAPRNNGFWRSWRWAFQGAYQHYTYDQYFLGDVEYGGNFLPGIPRWSFGSQSSWQLGRNVQWFVQYLQQSSLFLNDANTQKSQPSHILQSRVNFHWPMRGVGQWQFFVGGDNLLNDKYSLGYDVNGFGTRFYNAAPSINGYFGVGLRW
jgi:iron complex outermembrane receptor protein